MDDETKRWTARPKTALVLEIIRGKTTVVEASRTHDLPPSEIEKWVDDGKRGMENALRANPQDLREQYEKQLKDLQEAYGEVIQEAYGEAMLELHAGKKIAVPAGRGREVIETIRHKDNGYVVSISQLCRWFDIPRRTVYYKATKKPPTVQKRFGRPHQADDPGEPSFCYLTVAYLLKFK